MLAGSPQCGQPSGVGENAQSGQPRAAAERRHLTVMICDLVGSTALSARLDPEDMGAVIDAYHAACARITLTYDGFLADFRGDGILAYFGYPRAHEDDAERTVRAALDIIAAVARLETRAARTARGPHWHRDRLGGGRRPRRRGQVAGACCGRGHAEPCSSPSGLGRAGDGRRRRLHAPAARRSVSVCATSAGTSSRVLPNRSRRGRSRACRLPRAASRRSAWRV